MHVFGVKEHSQVNGNGRKGDGMCECGCTSNDERYEFPAPKGDRYILTLSGCCTDCDAPAGITIERIDSKAYWRYREMEMLNGELPFSQWPDSKGVAIVTGMRSDEFTKALLSHLVGISSDDMGEDGLIDEDGADVILDEMYEDAQFRPTLVIPNPSPS